MERRTDDRFFGRGGYAASWSTDGKPFHLVARRDLLALYDETGEAQIFRDVGKVAEWLADCLKEETERLAQQYRETFEPPVR